MPPGGMLPHLERTSSSSRERGFANFPPPAASWPCQRYSTDQFSEHTAGHDRYGCKHTGSNQAAYRFGLYPSGRGGVDRAGNDNRQAPRTSTPLWRSCVHKLPVIRLLDVNCGTSNQCT
jgi:hypothetical protein